MPNSSHSSPSKGWCTGDYPDLKSEDNFSDSEKSSACGPSGDYYRINGAESVKLDSKAWCKSAETICNLLILCRFYLNKRKISDRIPLVLNYYNDGTLFIPSMNQKDVFNFLKQSKMKEIELLDYSIRIFRHSL